MAIHVWRRFENFRRQWMAVNSGFATADASSELAVRLPAYRGFRERLARIGAHCSWLASVPKPLRAPRFAGPRT